MKTADLYEMFPEVERGLLTTWLHRWREHGFLAGTAGGHGVKATWAEWTPRMLRFLINNRLPTGNASQTNKQIARYKNMAALLSVRPEYEWFFFMEGEDVIGAHDASHIHLLGSHNVMMVAFLPLPSTVDAEQ